MGFLNVGITSKSLGVSIPARTARRWERVQRAVTLCYLNAASCTLYFVLYYVVQKSRFYVSYCSTVAIATPHVVTFPSTHNETRPAISASL